jgi:phosphate starvation-inducible PhoH-like protein
MIFEKVSLTAKNDSQKKLLKSIKENQITICNGVAGSGKTLCSIYMALSLLKDNNNAFQKILLVKSVTVLKNEELGFLKGDLREKVDPFMESFKSNAKKLFQGTNIDGLFESSIIHFLPLAYIRGTNLDNSIIILDETQNVSIDNARTLLTRIGENSKIICLGDTNQIDLKNKKDSSLEVLLNIFDGIDDIGCITMDENDENCRNPIIKTIERKFKEYSDSNNSKSKSVLHG